MYDFLLVINSSLTVTLSRTVSAVEIRRIVENRQFFLHPLIWCPRSWWPLYGSWN